ncbi:MAG: hypothetical protein U0930_01535 [Pirellulales bacterium]
MRLVAPKQMRTTLVMRHSLLLAFTILMLPNTARSECGDHLHSANSFAFELQKPSSVNESNIRSAFFPLPSKTKCLSCQSAHLPISVPLTTLQLKLDYKAISLMWVDLELAELSSRDVEQVTLSISDGSCLLLLRPPIV